ncbi:MAG: putative toxin-antitoxin system toxin component, PIN family [Chloroflexi bacterium]|nr:putative toxin-antitoxin system toxin component, PIN family [Chloroflexota bacterium]
MLRVVLDASVLISGLLSPQGIPARLIHAWREERFILCISKPILEEIAGALRYPKLRVRHGLDDCQIDQLVALFRGTALLTPAEHQLERVAADPHDGKYLVCALEGEADYIVSGDQDLKALETFQGIPIVSPAVFWQILRGRL